MKLMLYKTKNNLETKRALLTLALACLFLLSDPDYLLAQECEGTQFRTDDRGLVFVTKGEKDTLLIGGVWYECEGCGACEPVPNEGDQPRVTRSQPRPRKQQELTDEQIIELIERTKALTALIKADDEARLMRESFQFLDRLSLLARELQSLETGPPAQFNGLKLKLQDLAERATTIQEMGNIAYWSLEAALNSFSGESAREKAGWGFDDWKASGNILDLSRLSVDVPLPETRTPQYQAFKYIARWSADMYTRLLRLSERQQEAEKKGWELKTKRFTEYQPAPLTTRPTEEQKKKQEYLADLEKQAEALLKESEQMYGKAMEYVQEISQMQREFFDLVRDPSKCTEFLARHVGGK